MCAYCLTLEIAYENASTMTRQRKEAILPISQIDVLNILCILRAFCWTYISTCTEVVNYVFLSLLYISIHNSGPKFQENFKTYILRSVTN
jgi:hypothetical protein